MHCLLHYLLCYLYEITFLFDDFDYFPKSCRYSGPTVHFVDEQFDTGRTLAQRVVPVLADDTPEQLAARVLHEVRLICS
jgi:folate-dependent phosphoribosylglycinamide formyltransferase PurN